MGRNGATTLSPEETERIIELLKQHKTVREIGEITGRSTTKISNIKAEAGMTKHTTTMEKWRWLQENWGEWDIDALKKKEKEKEKVKRKSNFRTPYNQ